jgi:Zn-dependent membrane protease YugP
MFFGGYGLYMLFVLPALLLGLYAQFKVKSSFSKYSRVRTATGLTGAQIARRFWIIMAWATCKSNKPVEC